MLVNLDEIPGAVHLPRANRELSRGWIEANG